MRFWRAPLAVIVTAVLSVVLLVAGTSADVAAAQPASAKRAAVPWDRVGAGWVLAEYTSARPDGGSGAADPIGFTTPDGLASWPASRQARGEGASTSLVRYSLSGALVSSLGYSADGQVLYAASGTEFATGAASGLKLVSNGGTLIRTLPGPRTAANSCHPARWWSGGTILASCLPPGNAIPQLWLVPASGARPEALTPPRGASSGYVGDLDAWQPSSGLYLQGAGPCGVLQIFRQARTGSVTLVTVPHTTGDNMC
jgi:hypothetical protein